jgi:predicted ribosomally synthesized peptide with SipW-like signal peptide
MLKKTIGLVLACIIIVAVTAGGTWAYLSDTGSRTGNVISTSTLNLQVGAADPLVTPFSIGDVKPGSQGNASTWAIINNGSISGRFSVAFSTISNQENFRSEIETAAGDITDGVGELGGLLKIVIWMDTGTSGWSSGDYYLDPSSASLSPVSWTSGSTLPATAYFMENSFNEKISGVLQTINGGSSGGYFKIEYNFPVIDYRDNQAQGDSCVTSIIFSLFQ